MVIGTFYILSREVMPTNDCGLLLKKIILTPHHGRSNMVLTTIQVLSLPPSTLGTLSSSHIGLLVNPPSLALPLDCCTCFSHNMSVLPCPPSASLSLGLYAKSFSDYLV